MGGRQKKQPLGVIITVFSRLNFPFANPSELSCPQLEREAGPWMDTRGDDGMDLLRAHREHGSDKEVARLQQSISSALDAARDRLNWIFMHDRLTSLGGPVPDQLRFVWRRILEKGKAFCERREYQEMWGCAMLRGFRTGAIFDWEGMRRILLHYSH